MKILIIQPWIRLGGAELISVHLAYQLERRGIAAPIVCTFVDPEGMPSQADKVQYLLPASWVSKLIIKNRLFFMLFGPIALFILVLKHSRDADVLNPHNFPASWIAVIIGRMRSIPVIWTCNEPPEAVSLKDAWRVGVLDYLGWLFASSVLDRIVVRGVSKFHVLSERTRVEVSRRYRRNAQIIRSGVDLEFFQGGDPSVVIDRYGLDGKFVLLMVGKLHPQKRQLLGLRILHRVIKNIPNAVLLIVGDGPARNELEKQALEMGIVDHVKFLGLVSSNELADLYAACDVQLLTASNQSWGLTPFEALAAKRISIVSDDSGAAEIMAREGVGLVSSPNPEDYEKGIREIYNFPEKFQAMIGRGHAYVEKNLTHEVFGERFSHMVREVSGRNSQIYQP